MSNEKHDEFSSWRSLLGSRDALPEHGLDSRDRCWEKLSRRLGSEPAVRRPRRYFIYWMAAACLLLLLVPAALFLPAGRKSPAPVHPAAVTPPAIHPAEGEIVFRSSPPAGIPHHAVSSRATRRHADLATTAPPAAPISLPAPLAPASIVAALPPDSSDKILVAKELKVVHINEIDNPGQSQPAMTSTFKHSGEPDIKIIVLLKTRQ